MAETIVEPIIQALNHLKITKFVAIYEAGVAGVNLPPFKGATFRGAFGSSFKEVACNCPKNEKGDVLIHHSHCAYSFIFETSPHEGSEKLTSFESIPRPFIIDPPDNPKTYYAPKERFTLGFTLYGTGIEYLPYFIYVFDAMGKKGFGQGKSPAQLKQIFAVDQTGDLCGPIYSQKDRIIKNDYPVISGKDILSSWQLNSISKNYTELTINFITPARIKFQGQYISRPDFHVVLRSLVRRISSLLYFYHDEKKVDLDFFSYFEMGKYIQLAHSKVEWFDWERYSSRQKERLKMGGIVGRVRYQGDINPFLPWFAIGEWVNIGKNPVFGLGKISSTTYP